MRGTKSKQQCIFQFLRLPLKQTSKTTDDMCDDDHDDDDDKE